MIEYCQVRLSGEDEEERVIALNENGIFLRGKSFIEVFNKLGKDNWQMCGQTLDHSNPYYKAPEELSYHSMFYFMREIKE